MNIIYKTVLLFLCSTGIAYAGTSTGFGASRTSACAQAKNNASNLSDNVSSSCDCSDRGENANHLDRWICSADHWDNRSSRSSYSDEPSSSSSSYDSSPSRFQNTTPPGQRFVPIQIPQRSSYLLPGMP